MLEKVVFRSRIMSAYRCITHRHYSKDVLPPHTFEQYGVQLPKAEPVKDDTCLISYTKTNMPDINMKNPYEKERRMCILCKMKITPDYKNSRLLSQFVSRFTGRVYGRHITGLCAAKQRLVEIEIIRSIEAGYMPRDYRHLRYAHDPQLFNPDNPFRPHKY